MIILHRSNRMEQLADGLARLVAQPAEGADPFEAEQIVVQSRGMERFVSMHLARALGVWANPSFPFPRAIIERALQAELGPDDAAAAYGPDALLWTLAARLPGRLTDAAFEPLARYLDGDEGADLLLQLSERLARLFDDYLVYRFRPDDFVADWERGLRPDDFQAVLLRDLRDQLGQGHIAARATALVRALGQGQGPIPGLPRRLCLFGIASLPPLYLHVFEALSRRIEVHLFMLSPSQEYWADVRRPGRGPGVDGGAGGAGAQGVGVGVDATLQSEGHPLLASLGQVAREFHHLLEDGTGYVDASDGQATAGADAQVRYVDPGEATLLRALQSDMLHLRARGTAGEPARLEVPAEDRSIAVHACHGPMREVEVLHDQLVELLQAPGVEPQDIVVMAPDIDAYAPFIDAVFGQTSGRPRVAYRISDRRVRSTHALVDAFDAILQVLAGRMTAGEVLDLLGRAPVRAHFGIPDEALGTLRQWVADSGIRWGVDAQHRADEGQPALSEHTFRFGLDRLLLGHAMEGGSQRMFAGHLPFDGVDSGDAELLGRLSHFCQTLFACRERVRGLREVAQWQQVLESVMGSLLSAEGALAEEQQSIREVLHAMANAAGSAGFSQPLSLRAVRRKLAASIEDGAVARGFLAGGVTFCQLVPMRSIPFRVVCLIGMNDEDFPRRRPRLGFDRIASGKARPGDRNPPAEDRFLFLEAVLSAREQLIITYQGRGIHDNAVRPPSVLVAELISVLARGFCFPGEVAEMDAEPVAVGDSGAAEAHLLVHHRLQPFSPLYFGAGDDPRLFSYAQHFFEGASSLEATRAPTVFIRGPLPAASELGGEALGALSLEALARFIERPVRRFMQQRLGLYLEEQHVLLQGREPMTLDALARWGVGDLLLGAARRGVGAAESGATGADAIEAAVRASGRLPPGTPGQLLFEGIAPGVARLAAAERERTGGAPALGPLAFELPLSAGLDGPGRAGEGVVVLHGALRSLWPGVQLRTQYSRVGGRQELRLWLHHLVANALGQAGYCADGDAPCPDRTVLLGRPSAEDERRGKLVTTVTFSPVPDAAALLAQLVERYRQGQCFPLPFAFTASMPFAQALAEAQPMEAALSQARAGFDGKFGEAHDSDMARVYPDLDAMLAAPGPAGFEQLARQVLTPLLAHREVL